MLTNFCRGNLPVAYSPLSSQRMLQNYTSYPEAQSLYRGARLGILASMSDTMNDPKASTEGVSEANKKTRPTPEQIRQSIFENVTARDITVESITQVVNLGDYPKPTGVPHNIPATGTVKFVGRSKELEHLHQMLQQNNQVVIAAIAGITAATQSLRSAGLEN